MKIASVSETLYQIMLCPYSIKHFHSSWIIEKTLKNEVFDKNQFRVEPVMFLSSKFTLFLHFSVEYKRFKLSYTNSPVTELMEKSCWNLRYLIVTEDKCSVVFSHKMEVTLFFIFLGTRMYSTQDLHIHYIRKNEMNQRMNWFCTSTADFYG